LRNTTLTSVEGEQLEIKDELPMSESSKKILTMQQKWSMLWRMSLDMKKKLQDNFANLLQVSHSRCYRYISPALWVYSDLGTSALRLRRGCDLLSLLT